MYLWMEGGLNSVLAFGWNKSRDLLILLMQILGAERLVCHEGVSREIEGFYALEEAERNDRAGK